RKLNRLGKFPDECMALSMTTGLEPRREVEFDYVRPLNRHNLPTVAEITDSTMCAKRRGFLNIFFRNKISGPSQYTYAHLVDTIEVQKPDFVHASAGNQLVYIAERNDDTKWHIFHFGALAFLATYETWNMGKWFDFADSELLDDRNMLLWRRGEGRFAFAHTPGRYFSTSAVTAYEIDLAIYWVVHDDQFVYFGGQEVKQVRP
ncbi:hypothetical protein PFISCL1PPCAC_17994, partial [Pristionchus fissidentatus]